MRTGSLLQQWKHESRCDAELFTNNQIRANPLGHLRGDSGVAGVDIRAAVSAGERSVSGAELDERDFLSSTPSNA